MKHHEGWQSPKENADLSDHSPGLVRDARVGKEQAFNEIVDQYGRDLFRLALSLVRNPEDAEDLVQEVFIAAFEQLDRFEGRSTLKTWLIGILLRKVARFHRYQRIRRTVSLHDLVESVRTAFGDSRNVHAAKEVELRLDITAMLETLSRKHREVLVLREILGLSYEEIGETLRVPAGTVESRLFRARQDLRERFKEYLTS
jgi:RNA polymerase sigma-70 factor (ECF subfamily)